MASNFRRASAKPREERSDAAQLAETREHKQPTNAVSHATIFKWHLIRMVTVAV